MSELDIVYELNVTTVSHDELKMFFFLGRVAEVPPKFARVGGSRPDFGPEKAKKHKKKHS